MPKFTTKQFLATKAARDAIFKAHTAGNIFTKRHYNGDWGEVDYKQKDENKRNFESKTGMLKSEYILGNGSKVAITTEFESNITVFHIPGEDLTDISIYK